MLAARLKQPGPLVRNGAGLGRQARPYSNLRGDQQAHPRPRLARFSAVMRLAGAGTRGGQVIGATDDLGFAAVDEPCHVSDLHATILHLMGVDHERLTFFYKGLEERITGTRGNVVTKAIS